MSDKYQPPPGPPPGHVHFNRNQDNLASNNPFRDEQPQHPTDAPPAYEAPPGPPPTWQDDKKQHSQTEDYAPPPGPPPSHSDPEPPPYDPWLAVPDNALLPPPPAIREERSPAANATYDDAAKGHAWCRANPLWNPGRHNTQTVAKSRAGDVHLTLPPNTRNITVRTTGPGRTHVRSTKTCTDSVLLSDVPLYFPTVQQESKTIYFELKVLRMGSTSEGDAGIALGFLAPPYPSWRLPGWHRASLGVHGDDGRRYVDDSYGGKDFVDTFRPGDVIGIGMKFVGNGKVEVFCTRNGKKDGGWDLHEEKDADVEEGDVRGLEGRHDLLGAVGCFGEVEFEVCFQASGWQFRP